MINLHINIKITKRQISMILYVFFVLILAVAISFMPVATMIREQMPYLVLYTGIIFWSGLIGTIIMAYTINRSRKSSYLFNKYCGDKRQLGVVHFFQNIEATIADITMFASMMGLIVSTIIKAEALVKFILYAIFVFSFSMHCMLNGINYKYIKYKTRR